MSSSLARSLESSSFWRIASSIPVIYMSSQLLMEATLRRTTDIHFLSVRGGRMVVMTSFPIRFAVPGKVVAPGRIGYDLFAGVLRPYRTL